jgi:hypothetical protein
MPERKRFDFYEITMMKENSTFRRRKKGPP